MVIKFTCLHKIIELHSFKYRVNMYVKSKVNAKILPNRKVMFVKIFGAEYTYLHKIIERLSFKS